ncbi:MAG: hypothetical protein WCE50_14800 [Candidatus Acidiferrum sp.]
MSDAEQSNVESHFRKPTAEERSLLERLLEAEFPGKDELAPMVRSILVRTTDVDGGLELRSQTEGKSPVVKRVPVEAEAKDEDGVVIHMLLHVVDGKPVVLEIFREDGATVRRMPDPSALELIVLPPMPDKGWAHPT